MLNFSETHALKYLCQLQWFPCLFSHAKVRQQKLTGVTVWIVSTSQMSANFSWVWKRKILDNCFLIWCRKMQIKNVQHSLRILGFALRSTPSHHLHFIIHPVLFIYAYDVKRVISSDHSSCIYHPFIHWIINLFMWSMYSAMWVF